METIEMTLSDKAAKRVADIERLVKKARDGDPAFWRHSLAEATVALLERGIPVTIESLIERLETTGDSEEVVLKRIVSEAAIERLRQIVVREN